MTSKTYIYNIPIFHGLCILPLRHLLLLVCILLPSFSFSQSFSEGEALFRSDQPELAIPMLEKSLIDGSAGQNVYNYLGTAYMQTGDMQKAMNMFIQGTAVSGTDKKSLYYNAGNAAFMFQDFLKANEYFSFAIAADPAYASAYLNRANTNVHLAEYTKAIDDYAQYLVLEPNSDQADAISRMVSTLTEALEFQKVESERLAVEKARLEEEEKRLVAEKERLSEAEKRLTEEEERLAAIEAELLATEQEQIVAAKVAAEAERRKQILAEVSASFQSDESTNLSAGTEGVLDYEYEEAELE